LGSLHLVKMVKIATGLILAGAGGFVTSACLLEIRFGEHVDGFIPYMAIAASGVAAVGVVWAIQGLRGSAPTPKV